MMTEITLDIREEWVPLLKGAHRLITQVMEAGTAQRVAEGRPTDEWRSCDLVDRVHHMFMHTVATQTRMQTNGDPWSLTNNTSLEDYKHAAMSAVIIITRQEILNAEKEILLEAEGE